MIPPTCDFWQAKWMVARCIEGEKTELWLYIEEMDARIAYEALSLQWNECFLTRIVDGPGPEWRTSDNERSVAEAQRLSCERALLREMGRCHYCAASGYVPGENGPLKCGECEGTGKTT